MTTKKKYNKEIVSAMNFLLGIESIQVKDYKEQYPLYANYVINILKRENALSVEDGKIINIQKRIVEACMLKYVVGIIDSGKRGRPLGAPYKKFTLHCDADIYEWLLSIKGNQSITKVINDILRKEAGL